ncbi:MAG: phosphoribosylanthranilate isomerase, partial [Deltaproteobacteria bacterium]|nr:phosphoribosylanthranilate isomerase [Deltaproteobacteria bacterium]
MVKVKICGIRTLDEAMMCVEEGSDGLGFICGVRYKAEDATEIDTIRKIVKNLPPYVTTVSVTHLEDVGELKG